MATLPASLLINEVNVAPSSKLAGTARVQAGSSAAFRIVARNSGLHPAPGMRVTDTLPLGLSLVPESLQGASYDAGTRSILWSGHLPASGEHEITFAATVPGDMANGTWLTNTALFDDGFRGIVARSAAVSIVRGDLSSSELAASPTWIVPGGAALFSFHLVNSGTHDMDATLAGELPVPLTLLAGSAYASAGDLHTDGRAFSWEGTVVGRGMVLVRLMAVAPVDMTAQTVIARATLADAGGITKILEAPVMVLQGELFVMPLLYKHRIQ